MREISSCSSQPVQSIVKQLLSVFSQKLRVFLIFSFLILEMMVGLSSKISYIFKRVDLTCTKLSSLRQISRIYYRFSNSFFLRIWHSQQRSMMREGVLMFTSSMSQSFLLRSDFVSKKMTLKEFLSVEIWPDCSSPCSVVIASSMWISRCRQTWTFNNLQTTSYYLCFCAWACESASSTLTSASQYSSFLMRTLNMMTISLSSSSFTKPYFWQNSTNFQDQLYESMRLLSSYLIWLMVLLILMISKGDNANFQFFLSSASSVWSNFCCLLRWYLYILLI